MPRAENPRPPRDAVFWFDRQEPPLPPVTGSQEAEVVVVGGGMMGLMAAHELTVRGRAVCLVEADTCGGAASGRSSGFITPDSELELADLESHFGADQARRLWDFAKGGVDFIRDTIAAHGIDCDQQEQDSLFVAVSRGGAKRVRDEHATRQRLGYASTHHPAEGMGALLGGRNFHGGVRFGGTFGIDGYRCCAGIRDALVEAGVPVFERSPVTRLHANGVDTPGGSIRAANTLVCTDRFLPELGLAEPMIYHAQTFLAVSEPLPAEAVSHLFPAGPLMVWDTDLLYRYFRLTGDRRLLIGGSTLLATYQRHERHRPRQMAKLLARYLKNHFPQLDVRFAALWPGLIGISKDFAPIVGRSVAHPRLHFAGGAAGLPWAAALGRYLAEKIVDGRDDLDAPLTAHRRFAVTPEIQRVIGKPAAFALAHGLAKLRG